MPPVDDGQGFVWRLHGYNHCAAHGLHWPDGEGNGFTPSPVKYGISTMRFISNELLVVVSESAQPSLGRLESGWGSATRVAETTFLCGMRAAVTRTHHVVKTEEFPIWRIALAMCYGCVILLLVIEPTALQPKP